MIFYDGFLMVHSFHFNVNLVSPFDMVWVKSQAMRVSAAVAKSVDVK